MKNKIIENLNAKISRPETEILGWGAILIIVAICFFLTMAMFWFGRLHWIDLTIIGIAMYCVAHAAVNKLK